MHSDDESPGGNENGDQAAPEEHQLQAGLEEAWVRYVMVLRDHLASNPVSAAPRVLPIIMTLMRGEKTVLDAARNAGDDMDPSLRLGLGLSPIGSAVPVEGGVQLHETLDFQEVAPIVRPSNWSNPDLLIALDTSPEPGWPDDTGAGGGTCGPAWSDSGQAVILTAQVL